MQRRSSYEEQGGGGMIEALPGLVFDGAGKQFTRAVKEARPDCSMASFPAIYTGQMAQHGTG